MELSNDISVLKVLQRLHTGLLPSASPHPKPPARQLGGWAGGLALMLLLALLLFLGLKNKKGTGGDGVADHGDTYTETINGATFKMIAVPGGTFTMGDLYGEGEYDEAQHRVTLSAYHLGETEVTQRLYLAVMGSNPSRFSDCLDCPVEGVSWEDAQSFINKLNTMSTRKYRLPTEAEWEFAARECGRKVRFGNGKKIADPKEINFDASAEYKKTYSVAGIYRDKTTAAKTFGPNDLRLYDMAGNVYEWCADWYGPYTGPATNPQGANSGSARVIRGGGWQSGPQDCRVAIRFRNAPGDRAPSIGFRLAAQ